MRLQRSHSVNPRFLTPRITPLDIITTVTAEYHHRQTLSAHRIETCHTFNEEEPKLEDPTQIKPSDENVRWLYRKDFVLLNGLWILLSVVYAVIIITIATTITVYRCMQIKADSQANTTTSSQLGRLVAEPCSMSTECLENGFCSANFVCACAPDFYYDMSKGQCLTFRTHADSCRATSDCNVFAHLKCISGLNTHHLCYVLIGTQC